MRLSCFYFLIVTFCIGSIFLPTIVIASTLCHQTIELVGKTDEDTSSLLYYEYTRGECEVYRSYKIIMAEDSVLNVVGQRFDFLTFPMWTDSSLAGKIIEPAERMLEKDDRFAVSYYRQFFLATPPFDSGNAVIVDSVCRYMKKIPDIVVEPEIDAKAKLLYSKPGGLYMNYGIKDAYYYPRSRLLFILTEQPRAREGDDTMHGVLIYRLVR